MYYHFRRRMVWLSVFGMMRTLKDFLVWYHHYVQTAPIFNIWTVQTVICVLKGPTLRSRSSAMLPEVMICNWYIFMADVLRISRRSVSRVIEEITNCSYPLNIIRKYCNGRTLWHCRFSQYNRNRANTSNHLHDMVIKTCI